MITMFHPDLPGSERTAVRPCDERTLRAAGWVTQDELDGPRVVSLTKTVEPVEVPADSAPKKAWIVFADAHQIDVDPKLHAVEYVAAVKDAFQALEQAKNDEHDVTPDGDQPSETDSKESGS